MAEDDRRRENVYDLAIKYRNDAMICARFLNLVSPIQGAEAKDWINFIAEAGRSHYQTLFLEPQE
jgi:hypothetical protein